MIVSPEVVLTAAGATASAMLITGLIAMLKRLVGIGPWISADREPTVAFVLSAVLVLAVSASLGAPTFASAFAAFLAWYGIAQIAMGVHDTVKAAIASTQPSVTVAATPSARNGPLPEGSDPSQEGGA